MDTRAVDCAALRRVIEERFECSCSMVCGTCGWVIRLDTTFLPHTWELFQRYEQSLIAAVRELLQSAGLGGRAAAGLDIRHVAALPRYAVVLTGVEGVVQVPEAPLYFVRTNQLPSFRPEMVGIRWPL